MKPLNLSTYVISMTDSDATWSTGIGYIGLDPDRNVVNIFAEETPNWALGLAAADMRARTVRTMCPGVSVYFVHWDLTGDHWTALMEVARKHERENMGQYMHMNGTDLDVAAINEADRWVSTLMGVVPAMMTPRQNLAMNALRMAAFLARGEMNANEYAVLDPKTGKNPPRLGLWRSMLTYD